jgi:CRP/FNR family transcriptional regulator
MTCFCENSIPNGTVVSPKCIKNIWLFSELEPKEMDALASVGKQKLFRRRAAVFHQGDSADSLFLIKSGRIKLSKLFEDGREATLDYRKAGDTFGENTFSEEICYPVTAWCVEDTYTCGINKSDFEQLILKHPTIGLRMIRKQSELIANLTTRLGDMAIPSLEERLFQVLINVAREHGIADSRGVHIQFPLTHEDLSFLTGSHRVTITKAIKKLENDGRIEKEGRSYILKAAVVLSH